MKETIRFILLAIIGVIIAFYAGAMFNFFPFIANDILVRAIGYSTLIICTTIVICTCLLLKK